MTRNHSSGLLVLAAVRGGTDDHCSLRVGGDESMESVVTITEELETHPIFEAVLREIVGQLKHGITGGAELDPTGWTREPHTGLLIYTGGM